MAYGGAMKGSMKREIYVKEKKNEEGEETKSRTGLSENAKLIFKRESLCDGTSHTGGSHYLLNSTKMPLKLNSQKLKTSKICFQFL